MLNTNISEMSADVYGLLHCPLTFLADEALIDLGTSEGGRTGFLARVLTCMRGTECRAFNPKVDELCDRVMRRESRTALEHELSERIHQSWMRQAGPESAPPGYDVEEITEHDDAALVLCH